MRLTTRDVARIRELRYEDGLTLKATAAIIGCSEFPVSQYAPGRPGKIDNVALREAFLASSVSAVEVARRMGWECLSHRRADGTRVMTGDGSRVKRAIGLLPSSSFRDGTRYRSVSSVIDAETAALMAEAIGVMPWEVGA